MATQEQKALLVDLTGALGIVVMKSMASPSDTNPDFDFLLSARNTLLPTAPADIDYDDWLNRLQNIAKKYADQHKQYP